jgi:HSP20 family molecular chaperone IbpA
MREKTLISKMGVNQASSNGMILLSERGKSSGDIFIPPVDIIQSQQYIILIDLPGVTFEEIEISR